MRTPSAIALRASLAFAALALAAVSPAQAVQCHVYRITLQGITTIGDANAVSSTQEFVVEELAIVREAGVVAHPVEFVLRPLGDLNASAMPGQIMLMTNSAFAMNTGVASAQFDLASVAVSDVVAFQLDPGTSFINPAPNVFIAPGIGAVAGGLGGLGFLPGAGGQLGALINDVPLFSISYLVPRTGSGYFYSPGGAFSDLAGELTLMGSALDNAAFQGQYQAGFTGPYVGSVEC